MKKNIVKIITITNLLLLLSACGKDKTDKPALRNDTEKEQQKNLELKQEKELKFQEEEELRRKKEELSKKEEELRKEKEELTLQAEKLRLKQEEASKLAKEEEEAKRQKEHKNLILDSRKEDKYLNIIDNQLVFVSKKITFAKSFELLKNFINSNKFDRKKLLSIDDIASNYNEFDIKNPDRFNKFFGFNTTQEKERREIYQDFKKVLDQKLEALQDEDEVKQEQQEFRANQLKKFEDNKENLYLHLGINGPYFDEEKISYFDSATKINQDYLAKKILTREELEYTKNVIYAYHKFDKKEVQHFDIVPSPFNIGYQRRMRDIQYRLTVNHIEARLAQFLPEELLKSSKLKVLGEERTKIKQEIAEENKLRENADELYLVVKNNMLAFESKLFTKSYIESLKEITNLIQNNELNLEQLQKIDRWTVEYEEADVRRGFSNSRFRSADDSTPVVREATAKAREKSRRDAYKNFKDILDSKINAFLN